eukprot:TRINITY_DN3853_c0_g1_i1.p1 TRINITY_DN3853_c0_g1~~TRINITY_DN3853_c0_g1_i1.p1  ORF type:complete len:2182 (+),score=594.66 TRINITY_DN3853_c0_g1_i1:566-6547(+)
MWAFLEPVQKSGAAPARKVLVERCATDRGLTLFICNTVKDAVAARTAYRQLFTFYTATVLELLNMHDVNDSLVRDLWPFLITGISSSNDGYQVSSLMLLSALSWRVTLSHSLISGAALAIASRTLDHLHSKAVLTLLILLQNAKIQSAADVDAVLSDQAVELLVDWSDLSAILNELIASPRQYSYSPLIEALLDKLVRMSPTKPEAFKFLHGMVTNLRIEKFVPKLVRDLLSLYNAHHSDESSVVHSDDFAKLMKLLDTTYSTQFDQGVDTSLQGATHEPAWKQLFKESRHQVLKTTEPTLVTTLQLCLRQSTPKLKMHALESLVKMHRKQGSESTMGSLLERSVLEHLSSDDEQVALHALEVKGIEDVVAPSALFTQLQRLIMQGSQSIILAAVRVLAKPSYINKDKASLTENAVPVLLTALLHRNPQIRAATWKECEAFPHPLFSSMKGKQGSDDFVQTLSSLATAVSQKLADLHPTLATLFTTCGTQMKAVALLIVGRALAVAPSRQVLAALAREILPVISSEMSALVMSGRSSITAFDGEGTSGLPPCSSKQFEQLCNSELSTEAAIFNSLLHWSLENLLSQLSSAGPYDESHVDVLEQSFKAILAHPAMGSFKRHLQHLFAHLGKHSTRFLETFWTSSSRSSSLELVRSLNMCAALLSDGASAATTLFDLSHLYVMTPGLLVPLMHASMHVRVASLNALRGLHQVFSNPDVVTAVNALGLPQTYLPIDQLAALVNSLGANSAAIQASQAHLGKMFELQNTPAIQRYILSRALQLPYRFAQIALFASLRATPNSTKLAVAAPLLQNVLARANAQVGLSYADAKLLESLFQLYGPDVVADLDKNAKLFDYLMDALGNFYSVNYDKKTEQVLPKHAHGSSDRVRFCVALCALAPVTPDFFAALSSDKQRKLFVRLCHLMLTSPYYVREAVQTSLRNVVIPDVLIQEELTLLADSTEPVAEGKETSSKRRKADGTKSNESASDLVGRLTVILEMFQQRPDAILGGVRHVPALFKLLGNIIEPSSVLAQDASNEYIEQLIFSGLVLVTQAIAHGLAPEKPAEPEKPADAMDVDTSAPAAAPAKPIQQRLSIHLSSDELKALEKHYSVDVIVRAIGARQNPTLHNSALLLLAQIARVFPQKVLSNIMAVFSFMGASTQRSDDNYTFIVIQKTVERVIPALLSAEQKLDGSRVSTSALINVFIDRFDTIPTHRRLLLFTLILKILRGRSYLPYVVVNLFRRHQEHQFLERQKADDGLATSPVAEAATEDDGTSVPSFCQSLLQKFSPHEAVSCLGSLVALMNDSREQLENSSLALVNLAKMNKVQLLIDGIDFIASYVVSKPFINQLVALSTAEEEKIQHYLLQLFRNLLVLYARATDQQKVSANSKKSAQQAEERNWLDISERVYEALERVNDLLTINSFVQVIGSLLQHRDASIQQKALLLFNDKLTQQSGLIADSHISLFLQLTQKLFSSVTSETAESKAHLSAVNRQTAALTVEIVARQFGSNTKYTETFLGLAKQVTQHLSAYTTERRADSESAKVQSSMLVAIATLCSSLDQQLLPLLNDFFPAILHTLKSATTSMSGGSVDDNQRLLQLSALSSLQVIIRTLGRFLSTYMSDLLTSLLQPALLQFGEQMVQKVRAVLELIAEHVRLRALLAPLSSAFTTLKASDAAKSMSLLMDFAGSVSKHMTRSDIQTQHKQMFGFYRQAFDYRAAVSPTGSSSKKNSSVLDSILAVEDRIIASFSQFVLRLNEAMFKPLFIAIIDWAQINNSAVLQSDAGYNPQRSLFFYRLLVVLADQLKSIFVPYFTYVVDHAVAILRNPANDSTTAGHVDSHLLLSSVIAALHKCFLYDTEGWLDKEKFNKLMPAIVDQLDTTVRVGTVEQYRERVSRHLVPCVAQLAVAVNHDSLWKPLNYQVLLKTRSSNPVVRFSALSIVDELYHRLGEEFLVLLPESIQFFSELLEDSSEDVEDLMLKFVKRVEDLLGEENGLMNCLK